MNGEYPYSAIDHLGGRTSNLPTLIFIGIPFYLMGNVGFLQSFAFLLMVYIIFKTFSSYKMRLFTLLLLIISPSYLWEVYAKSDLMSNFIIVLLFLVLIQNRFKEDRDTKPALLGFFGSALLLTRLTAIIPLTLLLFKKFYSYHYKEKLVFVLVGVVTILLSLFICFMNVTSLEHFKMHNPFELQNRQLPTIVSIITILLPVFFSFKVDKLEKLLRYSIYFFLLPITLAFIFNIEKYGIQSSILDSKFDISYFNIAMPFIIIILGFNKLYKASH